ncbi:gephyrin-like molybdotransferase Glp [Sedimentitalea sp. HM32M-2]|uniref:molybdopterin molybdotransferase MoeA n=1 Tax=Sedimentitalea sp. HM32M-2 TaxID=3351566 RepID=UPI00362BF226
MTIQDLGAPGGLECGCDALDTAPDLLTIDQALLAIDAAVPAIADIVDIPLEQAAGRVLARAVAAETTSPPFDNSAMDGFALRCADLSGDGPWILPVAGRQLAGADSVGALQRGVAAQVLTGALLPEGADAVVMQEYAEFDGSRIVLNARPAAGAHIRRAGEDMQPGDVIVPAGRCVGPRDIAAIAATGRGTVQVRRPVRIGLLTTGDEVRAAGQSLAQAQIWDVNSPMLIAAMQQPGVELIHATHGGDTREKLRETLTDLAARADLIVTTGGISVGVADHVKPALGEAGGRITLSGVAIKPGKPVSVGHLNGAVWLGLPGNPVSAFVTWTIFGQRILQRLTGHRQQGTHRRPVLTAAPIRHRPGRCELRLATLTGLDSEGRERVTFPEQTQSARVSRLPRADGLILIPADADHIPTGGMVEFLPFPMN